MNLKRFCCMLFIILFACILWRFCSIPINNPILTEKNIQYIQNDANRSINVNKKYIYIKTDVIDLKINLYTGEIYQGRLLKFQERVHSFKKLDLINTNHRVSSQIFSRIIKDSSSDKKYKVHNRYYADHVYFKMLNGQKKIFVPIHTISTNGICIIKTFILQQGSYHIRIEYKINNNSCHKILCYFSGEIKNRSIAKEFHISDNHIDKNNIFEDFAYSSDHKKYTQYSFQNFKNHIGISLHTYNGWITTLQKYFFVSWIFHALHKDTIYIMNDNIHNETIIGYKSAKYVIHNKKNKLFKTILWMAPKHQRIISITAPYFNLIMNYGWFGFLSRPLFQLLHILYFVFNNWGFAIILITCIVRILTHPFMKAQYLATIKMRLLQPEINMIKEKFKNDRNKIYRKTLSLYKAHNVNPISGLFPVVIQMPIFLSLYYTLVNSVELRHSPFIFWINDLSDKDPFYILPILMGITVFLVQKTALSNFSNVSTTDKIMNLIPVLCTLFFLCLPAGLVLYYTCSNIITIYQQILINNDINIYHKK